MKYIVHTDGGARGNPGPSAVGVVIESYIDADDSGNRQGMTKEIAGFGKKIADGTNNVAEYMAVIEALTFFRDTIQREEGSTIDFYLDSTLVVNQLNGIYKVKESHLRELLMSVRSLEAEVGGIITYRAVPREQNKRADFFVNQALDAA
jgi:ribonuclease HI